MLTLQVFFLFIQECTVADLTVAPEVTAFFQLLYAMVLGMMLGIERNVAGKSAGMRTYGLVSMGSCLFMIISLGLVPHFVGVMNVDIMRVLSGVVTGVGFIGAGFIMLRNEVIHGLTTAAGLWVSAGIGVAVGVGFYNIALFATAFTLLTFTVFWYVERHIEEGISVHLPEKEKAKKKTTRKKVRRKSTAKT